MKSHTYFKTPSTSFHIVAVCPNRPQKNSARFVFQFFNRGNFSLYFGNNVFEQAEISLSPDLQQVFS